MKMRICDWLLGSTLLIVTTLCLAGAEGSGGGSDVALYQYLNRSAPLDRSKRDIRAEFTYRTMLGLEVFEQQAWVAIEGGGEDPILPLRTIREARKKLLNLGYQSIQIRPLLKEKRIAENFPDGRIRVSSVRWRGLDAKYGNRANVLRMAIGVHEILSLIGLESTGNYPYSNKILSMNLEKTKKDFEALREKLFARYKLQASWFYSCDLSLYDSTHRDLLWKSPFPVRSEISASEFYGHGDELDGNPLLTNPNRLSGTTGGIYHNDILYARGRRGFEMFEMYREPGKKESYISFIYVIGDPADSSDDDWSGGIRLVPIRIDPTGDLGWFANIGEKLTQTEFYVTGNESKTFAFENYQIDISCARGNP